MIYIVLRFPRSGKRVLYRAQSRQHCMQEIAIKHDTMSKWIFEPSVYPPEITNPFRGVKNKCVKEITLKEKSNNTWIYTQLTSSEVKSLKIEENMFLTML